ncbi:ATP-binding protein [Pseudaestuariivita rosea]|uniref:ATP-binding protein n=1 Tax=Pseudaestuariivita rosea TaxID=2763263 RepID=UPI001ABB2135|nr:ATP-binding protein [Pseudaestuariivita rosea]
MKPIVHMALRLSPQTRLMLLTGIVLIAVSAFLSDPLTFTLVLGLSGIFLCLAGLIWCITHLALRRETRTARGVAEFVQHDSANCYLTNTDGIVEYQNKAALPDGDEWQGKPLADYLKRLFANPSAVLFRLQNKTLTAGSALEEVITRQGHMRLSVHLIGTRHFLWRIEEIEDTAPPVRGLDAIHLPMMTTNTSGTVLFANDAMKTLLGQTPKALGQVFVDLPLRHGGVHTIDSATGLISVRVAAIDSVGGRREIYLTPNAKPDGTGEANWTLFQVLPVPLLKISPDGKIVAHNASAQDIFDQPIQNGVRLSDLVEGLGRAVTDWIADTLDGRGLLHAEVLKVKNDDHDKYVQITLSRIMDDGKPALIAVLNDATEFKTLEAQFVQSQKMQAIGQLAGGVAHDFNNLLTAISGHCDLLLLRHDQGDPDYGDLVQINQNANRAASLVGQLLAFSRKQNLQPETMDLRDTLSDLTHLLNRLVGEKITLSLIHDAGLSPIRADKRQLEQVLMNLVVNARDAMPDGGEIMIETKSRILSGPLERDRAVVPAGHYVTVKVSDQGVGIPPEKLTKIFEPFYTTKRTGEGTGLGLSTAYGIVKQTGGYIFVDSVVGSGTTFTLYFPAHERPLDAHAPIVQSAEPKEQSDRQGDGVIMLVEDEAPVRAFASRALQLRGYTVIEADSAEQALDILEDETLDIDLFVTDVIMPGLDGPTWVKSALEKRPDVKVVFVSGYAEDSFSDDQADIPNSVFLPKPFSLTELTSTVQKQLQ